MKTLVTGGAGFIGSHLADALLARGDEVTVLDNFSTGKHRNLESALAAGADLIEGDILDRELVEKTLQSVRPQTVFHLAAQGEVQRSIEEPAFDATVNVVGTVNLIEASKEIGLDRFVFASTGGAIYGEGSRIDLPASESGETAPLCQYGLSKRAGEMYLELYRRMYMFNSVALRFANVYGPRQCPKGEAGAVAIFGELLMAGRNPTVFGDGTQTRDYIHVLDVVGALLAAREAGAPGPFNVGTGEETSVLALAEAIGRMAGREDFEPRFEPRREGEVERTYLDVTRAAEELGWRAQRDLEEGVEETLRADS